MKEFLISYYTPITHLVEILAAIAGSFYLYKSRDNTSRLFVIYLWLTVFVENLALYARFMHNNFDNKIFILIKNSPFCTNHWLYNVRSVILIFLLGYFFIGIINNSSFKKYIRFLVLLFTTFSIVYFIFSNSLFYEKIPYEFMLRNFIISTFVCLYYLNVIKSDQILTFYKSKYFYIGTALLLWSLAITPLFIFQSYYSLDNPNFIYLRQFILLCANIIMYLCFTIVFLLSYFKTK